MGKKKYFAIILTGGLGNQMFQYAFVKSMSIKYDCDFYFDLTHLNHTGSKREFELEVFQIQPKIYKPSAFEKVFAKLKRMYNIFSKIPFIAISSTEESLDFNPSLIELEPSVIFKGYFQSPKYFEWCRMEILKNFVFNKTQISIYHSKILKYIHNSNSVSLHFRRGDYIKNENAKKFHGNLGLEYYTKALKMINRIESNIKVFIFSDDIDWVEQNVFLSNEIILVKTLNSDPSWIDMYLMSCCKYNIIANSSYSWWAGYLNKKPGSMVFYPEKWYAELDINPCSGISDRWIKIETNYA